MKEINEFLSLMTDNRVFSTDELAVSLGLSYSGVRHIANKLGVEPFEKNPCFKWDYAAYVKLRAYVKAHGEAMCKLEKEKREKLIEKPEDHPLVKDQRFLELTYFPESEPLIFSIWEA